jgi:LysM repeat protein
MLSKEEEKIRNENFWKVKKADFLVTVKLPGTLVSTDEVMLKSELEGHSTIRYVIEEGTKVEGNFEYTVQSGDTLESIAESNAKDALNIKALNKDLNLDWDHLKPGQEITLPGKLLIELDPLDLKAASTRWTSWCSGPKTRSPGSRAILKPFSSPLCWR